MAILILAYCVFFVFMLRRTSVGSIHNLFPTFICFLVLYTYVGSYIFSFALYLPFEFHLNTSEDDFFQISVLIFVALMIFSFSSALGLKFAPSSRTDRFSRIKPPKVRGWLTVVILISFGLLVHIGYGWEALYNRPGYTIGQSGLSAARTVMTFSVPFVALYLSTLNKRALRLCAVIVIFFLLLGTGSRVSLAFLGFYLLGRILFYTKGWLDIAVVLLLFIRAASILLILRHSTPGGMLPYLSYFWTATDTSFLEAINYLFSFSFYASSETLRNVHSGNSYWLESLTPLPSRYLALEEMVAGQKISPVSPFTALGVSVSNAYALVLIFSFLGFFWSTVLRAFSRQGSLGVIVGACLFLAFCVFFTQYNLRGSFRFVYYAFLLLILFSISRRLLSRPPPISIPRPVR